MKFTYVLENKQSFEVWHPCCVEPKLQNGKSTVKTQLYFY